MEELRWILLGVGIIIVIAIYFWGRARRRDTDYASYDDSNNVPSFSAEDEPVNDWNDGVGPVRVVQSFNDDEMDEFNIEEPMHAVEADVQIDSANTKNDPSAVEHEVDYEDTVSQLEDKQITQQEMTEEVIEDSQPVAVDDVVALYLVAERGSQLKGEHILSASYAAQLEYGEMNIFHRSDDNGKIIFSMSNMMEPGSFDMDKMNEMSTRGISLFIQLSLCDQPVKALDEMLICAHSLSSLLNTQIIDQDRQILNEAFTRSLREKAKGFAASKNSSS